MRNTAIVLVALLGASYGLFHLRNEADGFRNVFNPNYWRDRSHHLDLYNAPERYLKRGARDRKEVLLTFDDGPHPESNRKLLDVLKENRVPAVFFVVGQRVKEHPELARRMLAEGHEVGNHTEDHLRLDTLSPEKMAYEISECERTVEVATGRKMTLIRPPGMRFNKSILAQMKAQGYIMVGWNVGAKDFVTSGKVTDMTEEQSKHLACTPDQIVERVLKQVKPGVIILLHDNPVTVQAVPIVIQRLKAEGYEFDSTAQFMANLPDPVKIVSNPPVNRLATR